MQQARVLVTGGTGFLGSYTIWHLVEKGYRVRAIRRGNKLPNWVPSAITSQVEWVEGDILEVVSLEEAMEDIDFVIHSAAIVSFSRKDRAEMYQVNVDGTANVVNIALEKNVKRLIHISSVAALGRTAAGGQVDESKKWEESNVNTHYARSKFKAELQVWRGVGEGLPAVVLNPSTILGYGDWNQGSCAIFKKIYNGFNWYTAGINGFVDVEDVARATALFLETGHSGERFTVNGDNWAFRKLQERIAYHFNKTPPSREAGAYLMGLAWRLERIKSSFSHKKPLITKESTKVALSKTYFANAKVLEALPGFSFTPLEETIEKACKMYLADITVMQP